MPSIQAPPNNLDLAEAILRKRVVRGDEALRCCMRAHSNISLGLEMAKDAVEEAYYRAKNGTFLAFAPRIIPFPARVVAPPVISPWAAPSLILAPLSLFSGKPSVTLPVPETAPELQAVGDFAGAVATMIRNASRDNCLPCVWSHTLGQDHPKRAAYGKYRTREKPQ